MVTLEELAGRRAQVDAAPPLQALLQRLAERAEPVLARMPPVPRVKALLSSDGGVCPQDGTALPFDPWSPEEHTCSACGRTVSGERHHAHWARAQHLWLAERAAHLATVAAFTEDGRVARRARELLAAYYELYFELPNRDNVLGPSHLFFSTYLESMWVLSYFAAAHLLRESGHLDTEDVAAVNAIAEEAAGLIGEFNEGMSNRQTWSAAALTALGVWFGDEELARAAIEERTGLLGHLADGFGADGMWFEGENYHLFALRGLLLGLHWARAAGAELLEDDQLAVHLGAALLAPAWSALPDLTFPARKDARFGVSLAHPAYLECWETGLAWLGDRAPAGLPGWLHTLYAAQVGAGGGLTYDAYLHDAGEKPRISRSRVDLSWWSLFTLLPELPAGELWTGSSRYLEQQGLAILRAGETYVSLECGDGTGGHGHPDRLHLTLHAKGVHWLPDPGAGSYVSRDLFWYRSTLAHNAPRLDGTSQPPEVAQCLAFDARGSWGWVVGSFEELRRTVVLGPRFVVDVLELEGHEPHLLELPWHLAGTVELETGGSWREAPDLLENEFVSQVEALEPAPAGSIVLRAAAAGDRTLRLLLSGEPRLLRATGPGLPGGPKLARFYLVRAAGPSARLLSVLDLEGRVSAVRLEGAAVRLEEGDRATLVRVSPTQAVVTGDELQLTLGGVRAPQRPPSRVFQERPLVASGEAIRVEPPPALDGTLEGFDLSAPLALEDELHYLRSEEPYPGPEQFSATAYVNWDPDGLYLAVEVIKPELVARPPDAPPLLLDNEPDDIHSDGIQVYYRVGAGPVIGYLIRPGPDGGGLLVRPLEQAKEAGAAGAPRGAWRRGETGYRLTVSLPQPGWETLGANPKIGFDLLVNEMRPGRVRRAGQLVWSGGGGWVYLRGDRHDPARLGQLELVG